MHTSNPLRLALLLPLLEFVSSIPLTVHSGLQETDIWVRKDNTLNATTWHSGHNRTTESSQNATTVDNGNNRTIESAPSIVRVLSTTNTTNATVSKVNTTNVTVSKEVNSTLFVEAAAGNLPIRIVNKWNSNNLKAYISGLDSNGALVMLGQDGNWVYPTTSASTPQAINGSIAIPVGAPNTTLPINLPGYITSGRIWIAMDGLQFFVVATPNGPGLVQPAAANPKDPSAGVNYAFAELTWGASMGIYADITAVDFVGLPLGIRLRDASNKVQSIYGTPANAAEEMCNKLKAQAAKDGRGWDRLCVYGSTGQLIRVLSPSNLPADGANPFGTYYAKYVNDVWNHYRNTDLIINTQTSPGNVSCRTQGNMLKCAGDNRGYAKPNNRDIFGCNTGPFAIQEGDNAVHLAVVPRLCAAFDRATLLLPGGNVQPSLPPRQYYIEDTNRPATSRPMNWYSKLVHQLELGGRGYAFAYDDVTPDVAEDQSGLVASPNPTLLTIIVGGS